MRCWTTFSPQYKYWFVFEQSQCLCRVQAGFVGRIFFLTVLIVCTCVRITLDCLFSFFYTVALNRIRLLSWPQERLIHYYVDGPDSLRHCYSPLLLRGCIFVCILSWIFKKPTIADFYISSEIIAYPSEAQRGPLLFLDVVDVVAPKLFVPRSVSFCSLVAVFDPRHLWTK